MTMDVGMSLGENSRYLLNYYYGQLSAFFGMGYKFSEFVFSCRIHISP